MNGQIIVYIRETIHEAQRVEQETHALSQFLRARASELHPAIQLPKENSDQVLLEFITQYIEHVPDFLEALSAVMTDAGIYHHGKYFIQIAENFFVEPPQLIEDHSGMRALIDEAYLAHRLIEEVNDRLLGLFGAPLLPMDMTFSNLIVHTLLGEPFANQLDLTVHYAIETLLPLDALRTDANFIRYMQSCKNHGWNHTLQRWPCLSIDGHLTLQLQSNSSERIIH